MRDGTALELVQSLAPGADRWWRPMAASCRRIFWSAPPYGSINVHSSLLPKYRGRPPSTGPSSTGSAETGVSIMYMAKELDAGDVILTAKTPIDPEEDRPGPVRIGWRRSVRRPWRRPCLLLAAGTAPGPRRTRAQATFAPMLSRELSPIDWTKPAGGRSAIRCGD
ncbi:MAG: formyltransferase family protein [Dysosmobacter sp.]